MTMTRKTPKASEPQAKLLARLFAGGKGSYSSGYNTPSEVVLVKHGWVSLGEGYAAPNPEITFYPMTLTTAGEEALLSHLMERRHQRIMKAGATP